MAAIVVRRSPSRALTVVERLYRPVSLLEEMEHFASDIWESATPVVYRTGMYPSLDMYQDKGDLVLRAELPGIRREDIGISLEGDCLTIHAEKKLEEVPKDVTYYTCERCFGDYSREVCLPFSVDAEKATATFENGLLEIRLHKAEEPKGKRIEVKVR